MKVQKDKIELPEKINYIAAFLTFNCNLRCPYCINRFGKLVKRDHISGGDWANFINRLPSRIDLPVTLQGGEPTMYPDFYSLVKRIREDISLDLLTNLQFDVNRFIRHVPPERFKRPSPYANIRVSFHSGQMDFKNTLNKVIKLKKLGYSIGIWEIDHPSSPVRIRQRQAYARLLGVDYRLKEFLGVWKGVLYGAYRYPNAVNSNTRSECYCSSNELLISPEGLVYRCHSDLYSGYDHIGSIFDDTYGLWRLGRMKKCENFGQCNPCDVKIKTDRFQVFGSCAVEIQEKTPPSSSSSAG